MTVNPVARPDVHTQLPDRTAHGSHIAGMTKGQTVDPGGDDRDRPLIPQSGQPLPKGFRLFGAITDIM